MPEPPAAEPTAPVAQPTAPAETPSAPESSVPEPVAPSEVEAPSEELPPGEAPTTGDDDGIDRDLLGAEPEATTPTPRRPTTLEADPDDEDAALRRAYADRYRPAGNPTKVNVVARGLFTNMGGKGGVGGRMGGARVDVGPGWNRLAVAATFSAWGGRVLLPRDTGAEMNAMLGVGPTLGLGRIALVGRGFVDLRVGYDFFYGVVNQRSDQAIVVQSQSNPNVVFTQTDNILPHGPRLTLDLGLISQGRGSPYFHGVGASMGWQALVHTFRGDLPVTNMLTMGLVYWFG